MMCSDIPRDQPLVSVMRTLLLVFIILGALLTAGMMLFAVLAYPEAAVVGIPWVVVITGIVLVAFRCTPLWPRGTDAYSRGKKPGKKLVAYAFVWGAGVAPLMIMGSDIRGGLSRLAGIGSGLFEMSVLGAYPEELIKGCGIILILLILREASRPWHGLLVGAFVGLGFELYETFTYSLIGSVYDVRSDAHGALSMWILRLSIGGFLHMVVSAIVGFGIGIAYFGIPGKTLSRCQRLGVLVGLWFYGFLIHFVWNLDIDDFSLMMVVIVVDAVVMYLSFIACVVVAWRLAARVYGQNPLRKAGWGVRRSEAQKEDAMSVSNKSVR